MAKSSKSETTLHVYGTGGTEANDVLLTEKQFSKLQSTGIGSKLVLKKQNQGSISDTDKVSGGAVNP